MKKRSFKKYMFSSCFANAVFSSILQTENEVLPFKKKKIKFVFFGKEKLKLVKFGRSMWKGSKSNSVFHSL